MGAPKIVGRETGHHDHGLIFGGRLTRERQFGKAKGSSAQVFATCNVLRSDADRIFS